jgi:putative membrane protein
MTRMVFQMIATIAAVPLCAHYLPGVHTADLSYALIAGAVLAVIYLLLRPVVRLISKALSWLTLGLLSVVIDAWLFMLCGMFMKEGLTVDSFGWAAAAALCVNALRRAAGLFFGRKK